MAEISCTQRRRSACSKVHDLIVRPVEVIGDEGYLLVECFEGVA